MITEPEESWEAEEGDSAYGRPHADDARPALNGPRGGGDWGEEAVGEPCCRARGPR